MNAFVKAKPRTETTPMSILTVGKNKREKEAIVIDKCSTSRGAPGDEKKFAAVHLRARSLIVFLRRQLAGLR